MLLAVCTEGISDFPYRNKYSVKKNKNGGDVLQVKNLAVAFALLAILLSFGMQSAISLQSTIEPTQFAKVIGWEILGGNGTNTNGGGGDPVPGPGVPK